MVGISDLLEVIFDCKTKEEADKKCRELIKRLEKKPAFIGDADLMTSTAVNMQSPSIQKLMDAQIAVVESQETRLNIKPPVVARIVGGEVNTGNGTRGPRKF